MASNTLPQFSVLNTDDQSLQLIQQNLVRCLTPVFNTPTMGGNLLTGQALASGTNTINHGLGRKLNGWIIVRQRAQASIWDAQDSNKSPNLTLVLFVDNPVNCDIYVF